MKRKNRVVRLIILIIFLSCALCSCSGYTEIENMDILTSHFVYKNDDKTVLGGGVANVRSFSDSMADKPVSYISAQGDTLYEASQNLSRSADHKLFYGGMRAIVIGERYARGGVGEFLDYIGSMPNHRTSVSVFTSSAEPRDIVEYKAVNDFSGGFAAESIVRTLQNEKQMIRCYLSDIWEARAQKQVGFVVPDIEINDEIMSVNGYSVFNGDMKIAHIIPELSAPLCYLLSRDVRGTYMLNMSDGTYVVRADMKKKNISVAENEENMLYVKASFEFDLTVTPPEMKEMTDIQEKLVRQLVSERINDEIEQILNMARIQRCDFLKLYKVYQTKNRSRFYEVDWNDMIAKMDTSSDVTIGKVKNNTAR